jgi:hypothetical protein
MQSTFPRLMGQKIDFFSFVPKQVILWQKYTFLQQLTQTIDDG